MRNGKEVEGEISFLGRFWLLLENTSKDNPNRKLFKKGNREIGNLIYVKPQWIPLIYDKKSQIDGHLLMGYVLVKKELYNKYEKDIFGSLKI